MLNYEIVVDKNESPNKCTILPLAYRTDFRLLRPGRGEMIAPLTGDLLLHPDGDLFNEMPIAGIKSLSVIDSNWKWLPHLLGRVERPLPRLARIPPGFETAYPRKSKIYADPDGGLATIEAIFIAAAFLGFWDETLFAKYHFGPAFLDMNKNTFNSYGLGPKIIKAGE